MKNSWWLKMMKFLMHHILALVQCASLNYSLWRKLERGEGKEIPIKQNNRKPSYGHVEKRKVLGKLLKKSQIARSLFVCYWIKGKVIGAKTCIKLEAISSIMTKLDMAKIVDLQMGFLLHLVSTYPAATPQPTIRMCLFSYVKIIEKNSVILLRTLYSSTHFAS